jgi:hypothetical protein
LLSQAPDEGLLRSTLDWFTSSVLNFSDEYYPGA